MVKVRDKKTAPETIVSDMPNVPEKITGMNKYENDKNDENLYAIVTGMLFIYGFN